MMDLEHYLLDRGLRITVEKSKGRCLVANRVFRPGEIILEQDPYASVLDAESESKRCDTCLMCSPNLKRCSACKSVRYCCGSCQVKEWKLHRSECQMLVKLKEEKQKMPPPSLRLVVRLVIKRGRQEGKVSLQLLQYEIGTFGEHLHFHFPECRVHITVNTKCVDNPKPYTPRNDFSETEEERLVLYAQMANLVKEIVNPLEVDLKDTCQLFCRIACNAHTICDEEFRPLGTGLYPVISIINHSCAPNSVLLFDGKGAIVRALQKIETGEEVTVSYVELAGSTSTRQKALKEQYYFVCQCQRCRKMETTEGILEDSILEGYKCPNERCDGAVLSEKDEPSFRCVACGSSLDKDQLTRLVSAANNVSEQANSAMRSGDNGRARLLFEQAEASQKTLFHEYSVRLMRTRDALMKICMDLQDWDSARSYCLLTLPAYERAYASNSPLVGLQYFSLGKLEWYLGDSLDAVMALTRAREILSVTHGASSRLVHELSSTLQEAIAEAAYKGKIIGSV